MTAPARSWRAEQLPGLHAPSEALTMLDFLSYLWWRITHPGPGLSPTDPVPYVPIADDPEVGETWADIGL